MKLQFQIFLHKYKNPAEKLEALASIMMDQVESGEGSSSLMC